MPERSSDEANAASAFAGVVDSEIPFWRWCFGPHPSILAPCSGGGGVEEEAARRWNSSGWATIRPGSSDLSAH